jgi:hypothetical protein
MSDEQLKQYFQDFSTAWERNNASGVTQLLQIDMSKHPGGVALANFLSTVRH